MATFHATSLEDIARMFDQHALDALRSSENDAIKVNQRRLAAREAAIWKLAAATVRDTSIVVPSSWESAYASFKDGPEFPPDTPALKVAFAAGMAWQHASKNPTKPFNCPADSELRTPYLRTPRY